LSAFSFLISEFVQYSLNRRSVDAEKRLADTGYHVGVRLLELISFREKNFKRELKLIGILTFISSSVWRYLFSKNADSLERSTDTNDEYMISDNQLLVNKFISPSKDYSSFNAGAFVAGIVEGFLDAAEFPAKVSAHTVPIEGQKTPRTVILIKFQSEVIARE